MLPIRSPVHDTFQRERNENIPPGVTFDTAHSKGFWLHESPYPIKYIDEDDDDDDDNDEKAKS